LAEASVPLFGIVKSVEDPGNDGFKDALGGHPVFVDEQRRVYKEINSQSQICGTVCAPISLVRAHLGAEFAENIMGGDDPLGGGGVLVLGTGDQGVLFQHTEAHLGDTVNLQLLMEAVELVNIRQRRENGLQD